MTDPPRGYKKVCDGCYANVKNGIAIAVSENGVTMYAGYDGGMNPKNWRELKTFDNFNEAFDEIRRDEEFMTSDEF